MIKQILVPIAICMICSTSCKKAEKITAASEPTGHSEKITEIDLALTFNFQRNVPDDFRVKLSENFSLEGINSVFNIDQKVEYFILTCKRSDGSLYQVYGTVDTTDVTKLSFQKIN